MAKREWIYGIGALVLAGGTFVGGRLTAPDKKVTFQDLPKEEQTAVGLMFQQTVQATLIAEDTETPTPTEMPEPTNTPRPTETRIPEAAVISEGEQRHDWICTFYNPSACENVVFSCTVLPPDSHK